MCMCMCMACVCVWWGSRSVCVMWPISFLANMLKSIWGKCACVILLNLFLNNVKFITTILDYPFNTEANALQQLLLVVLMQKFTIVLCFITGYVGLDL